MRTRWSGPRKVVSTGGSSKKQGEGQVQTRIPRVPRGRDNARGRGGCVKIIKPVVVTKAQCSDQVISQPPPSELAKDKDIDNTPVVSKITPVVVGAKSPVYISSKAVPDLHNKILAKIRLNKRSSKQTRKSLLGRPKFEFSEMEDRNDSKIMSMNRKEEELVEEERESPVVSSDDLEAYLASMFNMVDTYRYRT